MKRYVPLAVACAFLFGLVTSIDAHIGKPRYAFQFPDDMIPDVTDGDLSDWDIVPEAYWITADQMTNQFGAPMDLSDFNCRFAWGWNPTTNKLYFGVWFYDDMAHGTEHWSIEVDASHSGAQYDGFKDMTEEEVKRWKNARAQKYDLAAPLTDPKKGYRCRCANAATWVMEPEWTAWGGRVVSGVPDDFETPDELIAEFYCTPWEDLNWMGPDVSKIVKLEEGKIVGMETNRGDKDADPGKYDDAYWRTFGGVNAWKFADQMGDLILAPLEEVKPAVRSATWARIKWDISH